MNQYIAHKAHGDHTEFEVSTFQEGRLPQKHRDMKDVGLSARHKVARQAEMSRQRKPICLQEKHADATSIQSCLFLRALKLDPSKCLSASVEGLSCTEPWECFIMEDKYTTCNNTV